MEAVLWAAVKWLLAEGKYHDCLICIGFTYPNIVDEAQPTIEKLGKFINAVEGRLRLLVVLSDGNPSSRDEVSLAVEVRKATLLDVRSWPDAAVGWRRRRNLAEIHEHLSDQLASYFYLERPICDRGEPRCPSRSARAYQERSESRFRYSQ